MVPYSVFADDKPVRDLLVTESICSKLKDLKLPLRKLFMRHCWGLELRSPPKMLQHPPGYEGAQDELPAADGLYGYSELFWLCLFEHIPSCPGSHAGKHRLRVVEHGH